MSININISPHTATTCTDKCRLQGKELRHLRHFFINLRFSWMNPNMRSSYLSTWSLSTQQLLFFFLVLCRKCNWKPADKYFNICISILLVIVERYYPSYHLDWKILNGVFKDWFSKKWIVLNCFLLYYIAPKIIITLLII